MKRRDFIAGTAGVAGAAGAAGTAALAALSGCLEDVPGTDGGETDDGPNGGENGSGTDADASAIELPAIDAPGSEGGTVRVPSEGQVQLVNCIRITCPTSRAMLSRVGEARDELAADRAVGPDGDVRVLTVVDEYSGAAPSPSELADWWARQDGDWTIAVDEDGDLFEAYEVSGTPTTLAVDGAGEVHWRDEGGTTATNLVGGVEEALAAADS